MSHDDDEIEEEIPPIEVSLGMVFPEIMLALIVIYSLWSGWMDYALYNTVLLVIMALWSKYVNTKYKHPQ